MDGLLLDSERLAMATFQQACRESGFEPAMAVYQRCIGSTYEATERLMREGFGAGFPFDAVAARWSAIYDQHIQTQAVARKPGAREILQCLTAAEIPMALATSTHRRNAEVKLRLAGLDHFFRTTVCGGEARRGKPHPDPYLLACERLGTSPADCWALEDSMNGTRAALTAGLTVFQVPDLVHPDPHERRLGQHVVASLLNVIEHLQALMPSAAR